MRLSIFTCLVAWAISNFAFESMILAQTTLDRLEQQIRQRVSASREANPAYRSPAAPAASSAQGPLLAPLPDSISTANSPMPVYLGIVADDRMDRGRGARITEVRPGSPAEKAGLRKQDLITGLKGERVRQLTDMIEVLKISRPDEAVEFDVLRDGVRLKIKATLGRPAAAAVPTSQMPETIPLPPGELILPQAEPIKKPLQPAKTDGTSDRETIEQLNNRIAELQRRVDELERALSEARKNNK